MTRCLIKPMKIIMFQMSCLSLATMESGNIENQKVWLVFKVKVAFISNKNNRAHVKSVNEEIKVHIFQISEIENGVKREVEA